MTVSCANLDAGAVVSAGQTSQATASVSPGANRLVLVTVLTYNSAPANTTPTSVSGAGLTFTQVGSINFGSPYTVSLWRAMSASPSTGAITIDYGATSVQGIGWVVDHLDGVDTGGTNGSAAVVQSATAMQQPGTTTTATLAAFADANNATYGGWGYVLGTQPGVTVTEGTGFTRVGYINSLLGGGTFIGNSEFRADNDTSVDITYSQSAYFGGVAIEVRAAVVTQTAYPNADVTDGAWTPSTGADLYAVLDDASDTDYITTNSNTTGKVGLTALSTPVAGTQTLTFRASGSPAKKLIATLIEGAGTSRGTVTVDPLTSTATEYSITPSGVTNWGDLDVQFEMADATTTPTPSVSFGAIGTGVNGSTSINVGAVSGITEGDYLTLHVTSGATNSETPSTPSGWTLLGTGASTDGTFGIDTGPRRATVFGKVAGASEGAVTVATTNGNTVRGVMVRWTPGHRGYAWDVVGQGANDSTSGTGVSMTTAAIDWAAGDCAAVTVGQRVDSATQSSQSLTASGTTFGTRTNRATTAVTTGNDHRHVIDTFAAVTTGGGSAATTWAYTASASVSAGGVVVRLREVPPTEFGRVYTTKLTIPEADTGGDTALTVQDASHGQTADNLVLTSDTLLTVQDATHAHTADNVTLSIASDTALTVADASHAQAADSLALSTGTALSIQDSIHGHQADSPSLTTEWLLSIQEASHAHSAEAPGLTTATLLAIADALHAHLADNVTLSTSVDTALTIADALHGHTAESPALALVSFLSVDDATHAHLADSLALTTDVLLVVADAAHGQAADNVVLSITNDISLAIADALHAHAAEAAVLTTAQVLEIQDALHAHAADNVVLVAAVVFYLSEAEIDAIVTAILDLDIPAAAPATPTYGTGTLSAEERAMIAYKFATRVIP